jgi:GDP-mannose 6-dehydrogenase
VKDFRYPPKTVIDELDPASGDILETIYEKLEAPLIRTDKDRSRVCRDG